MKPEAFEELLLEHLDGALTEERRRSFEKYLRQHPEERDRVRQHEELDHVLGELAEETAGPMVNGAVARVTGAVQNAPVPRRRVAAGWWLAAAAAAVVAAGLWWQGQGDDSERTEDPASVQAETPSFLEDPEFLADFSVILALPELEGAAALLDVEDDGWMAEVVSLEVLDGA